MPNLRGASPVGRGIGDRAYAAHAISRGKLNRRNQGRGKIPSTTRVGSNLGRFAVGCSREMGLGTQVPRVSSRARKMADGNTSPMGLPGARGGEIPGQEVTAWCKRAQLRVRVQVNHIGTTCWSIPRGVFWQVRGVGAGESQVM